MKKTIFLDKYPVYTLEIEKDETTYKDVFEIAKYIQMLIENHKIATYISTFDHYQHTVSINGEIVDGLKAAMNVLFCFGNAIPTTKILAARPRSFGICELENSFIIEFLEPPKENLTEVMEDWAKSIKNK